MDGNTKVVFPGDKQFHKGDYIRVKVKHMHVRVEPPSKGHFFVQRLHSSVLCKEGVPFLLSEVTR